MLKRSRQAVMDEIEKIQDIPFRTIISSPVQKETHSEFLLERVNDDTCPKRRYSQGLAGMSISYLGIGGCWHKRQGRCIHRGGPVHGRRFHC